MLKFKCAHLSSQNIWSKVEFGRGGGGTEVIGLDSHRAGMFWNRVYTKSCRLKICTRPSRLVKSGLSVTNNGVLLFVLLKSLDSPTRSRKKPKTHTVSTFVLALCRVGGKNIILALEQRREPRGHARPEVRLNPLAGRERVARGQRSSMSSNLYFPLLKKETL